MSDFSNGLDKILADVDNHDSKSFTLEIIKLHENEIHKAKNFVPIDKEQIWLPYRVILLPLVMLVSAIWSVTFIFSSVLFGRILIKTGEGFLKPPPNKIDDGQKGNN